MPSTASYFNLQKDYQLSVLYMTSIIYICWSQSSSSSHLSPFPLGIHTFVLYICFSISAFQKRVLIPFSRFHIYALIYNICFSVLLHSVWHSLAPSTSLQMTQFNSFLWLSNIPLFIGTSFRDEDTERDRG